MLLQRLFDSMAPCFIAAQAYLWPRVEFDQMRSQRDLISSVMTGPPLLSLSKGRRVPWAAFGRPSHAVFSGRMTWIAGPDPRVKPGDGDDEMKKGDST
jgi:hypothetical protein